MALRGNENDGAERLAQNQPQEIVRRNILDQMDEFIERISSIRRALLGMSLSAIVLAPLSMSLSVYLVVHPSFYNVLDLEDEFGYVLAVFLGIVMAISMAWLVNGVRQYRSMGSWNKRYREYLAEKDKMDQIIAANYGLE
jgi:hypothetical protein